MPSLVAPTTNSAGMPTEIRFTAEQLPSGKQATIAIHTFEQLENFPLMTLKNKARDLVETIGESAVPSLNGVAGQRKLIEYIMDIQISLCATIGLRVRKQHFGAPADWDTADDQGYFGGDGALPSNAKNFLEANYSKPMGLIQPKHRGLGYEDSAEVNRAEAADAYNAAKLRNAGSIAFG